VHVQSFATAAEFAPVVQPVVERFPAESSVLASLVVAGAQGRPFDDAVWLLIRAGAEPVGAAVHIFPNYLLLTPFARPPGSRGGPGGGVGSGAWAGPAATALVEALTAMGRAPAGVMGTLDEAWAVALAWERATGVTPRAVMSERLFEMREPPAAPPVPGSARAATEADVPQLARMMTEFDAEAQANPGGEPAEPRVRRRLAHGAILLWEDDGAPVSLAGLTDPAAGVSRVGPVFTPREHRAHGYGSAVTAAATRLGLERGASRVVLYTDLANPTSNKIYQDIGYRPIGDAVMIDFRPLT
jgi:RimJ/RimL family protein N-acetyltransferase